jgi:hypothetical protein
MPCLDSLVPRKTHAIWDLCIIILCIMTISTVVFSIYISLLSSALRISVEKNLIISTKLLAGMSAKLISTWNPSYEEGSKHTLVDGMNSAESVHIWAIKVVVPDNVAREVPIVLRICSPHPYFQYSFDRVLDDTHPCSRSWYRDLQIYYPRHLDPGERCKLPLSSRSTAATVPSLHQRA